MKARSLAAALTVALLAGCQSRQPSPSPPTRRPAAPPALPQPERPEVYLQTGLAYELFVSRLTDLALERLREPKVRALAGRFQLDHQGISAQFGYAARRLDRLNYPIIGPLFEQRLQLLRRSRNPDATYRELMLRTHREVLAKHRAFARAGGSPTLRMVAVHAAEVESRHLAELSR